MKQKAIIVMTVFVILVLLAGFTSDVRERTFSLRTNSTEYANDEISVLLFEEIINSFTPDIWDFMVLATDDPVQDSTFIQVGAPQAITDFQFDLQIGFYNAETGLKMYRLETEDIDVVLKYFKDYWQEQIIPDISLWQDMTDELR